MDIVINKTKSPKSKPSKDQKLPFGTVFTDHMLTCHWSSEKGWGKFEILPFGPLNLNPSCQVFHYANEIFEGMKAYRGKNGEIRMFRPELNLARLANSSRRMGLPVMDEKDGLEAIKKLIKLDEAWIPSQRGKALYVRPFIIGTSERISCHPPKEALFCTILSPVDSYYENGLSPVKIAIETRDVRAVRGGTGEAKCGGNYGASVRAELEVEKKGYDQVLWIDGVERKYIEEVGSMNVMFKIDGKIITPKLTGSILPGITRRSIIEYLASKGTKVEERLISIDEVLQSAKNGKLEEAWGCGTAAVVSPIGMLDLNGEKITVSGGKIGKITQQLYDAITSFQYGEAKEPEGWITIVK